MYDLAAVLKNNPGNQKEDFNEISRNSQNRELLLENRFLKEKISGLGKASKSRQKRVKFFYLRDNRADVAIFGPFPMNCKPDIYSFVCLPLENQLQEKSLRIKMLEKLVLETHL